jgi:hypothetical protein
MEGVPLPCQSGDGGVYNRKISLFFMSAQLFSPCPYLPMPPVGLDHNHLSRHGAYRGEVFYLSCLEYGQALWLRGYAARAILCLDRAMGAELQGDEPLYQSWPMPYAAMAWFLAYTPPNVFIGNPRVHFQHYAARLNEPRRDQRAARAWACWAIARRLHPEWPGDPKHLVVEPVVELIGNDLKKNGLPSEDLQWEIVLNACRSGIFSVLDKR